MTQEFPASQHPPLTPFQRLLGSRFVTGAGMLLSRYLPPSLGYTVADLVAGLINRLKPDVYWILYHNLQQVLGPGTDRRTLHRVVRRGFRNKARTDYDLWHVASLGPEAAQPIVDLAPELWAAIDLAQEQKRGLILAAVHTCGLDLALLAMASHGIQLQALGLADPPAGGFDLMDEMRAEAGVRLTPISVGALREAVRHLRAGGLVATGVDRPVGGEEATVELFGQPASLPTGHVRLALTTDALILVGSAYRERRRIKTRFSPPLEMTRKGDRKRDLQINLRRVTGWLETFIRNRPDQWALFLPVWPQYADKS